MATYIQPDATPSSPFDSALEDIFHDAFAGITGIPANLVRPRYQPEPPNQPDFNTDWMAFGCQSFEGDWNVYKEHDPTANGGLGGEVQSRDQFIKVLTSFYGPNAESNLAKLRDGLAIQLNLIGLFESGIKLVAIMDETRLPALLKERWVNRVDMPIRFTRRIIRAYAVNTIDSAEISLDNEHYITTISITNP